MAQVRNICGETVYAGEPINRLVDADEIVEVPAEALEGLIGPAGQPSTYWAEAGSKSKKSNASKES